MEKQGGKRRLFPLRGFVRRDVRLSGFIVSAILVQGSPRFLFSRHQ
jgi:hypothetical protein